MVKKQQQQPTRASQEGVQPLIRVEGAPVSTRRQQLDPLALLGGAFLHLCLVTAHPLSPSVCAAPLAEDLPFLCAGVDTGGMLPPCQAQAVSLKRQMPGEREPLVEGLTDDGS